MAVDQIDVSNWQRGLSLNAARDAGIGSVIAKASEGVGYTDPTYGDFQGWLLALIVCFSRIYLNRHFLSDVLCGVAIGVACTWLTFRLTEKLIRIDSLTSALEHFKKSKLAGNKGAVDRYANDIEEAVVAMW